MNAPQWLKPGLLGAGIGAAALAILGFSVGGWVTSSTAGQMANAQANEQTVSALVPFCVAASQADPNAIDILPKLREARSYQRGDIVSAAGWATAPGTERPNSRVAAECAVNLSAS